jgi:hypothetical protein
MGTKADVRQRLWFYGFTLSPSGLDAEGGFGDAWESCSGRVIAIEDDSLARGRADRVERKTLHNHCVYA